MTRPIQLEVDLQLKGQSRADTTTSISSAPTRDPQCAETAFQSVAANRFGATMPPAYALSA
jgi:hypothetical protein